MEQWEFDSYGYIEAYIMRAKIALEKAAFPQDDKHRAIGVVAAFPDAYPFFFDGERPRTDGTVPDVDASKGQILPEVADYVKKTAELAVKGGNAVIFACFHQHEGVVTATSNGVRAELAAKGLPEDLVQVVYRTNEAYMRMLKKRADAAVLGDESIQFPVESAMTENTLAFFDDDTDLEEAVPLILAARAKDNGTDPAAEQTVFLPWENLNKFATIADRFGGYYVWNLIEGDLIRQYLFSDASQISSATPDGKINEGANPKSVGKFNPSAIGRTAQEISETLYLKTRPTDKVLLVPNNGIGSVDMIVREKLCPVMAVYPYRELRSALGVAKEIIARAGIRHSVSIWPGKVKEAKAAAFVEEVRDALQASRFSVGAPAASADAAIEPTYSEMYWTIRS
jgi:hypothetical protein